MKPPYPISQTRDSLSTILRHRRSQVNHLPPKVPRSSIDTIKQNFQSTSIHAFSDNNEIDELIDNDNVSRLCDIGYGCFITILTTDK